MCPYLKITSAAHGVVGFLTKVPGRKRAHTSGSYNPDVGSSGLRLGFTWRGRGLSKSFIRRVIIGVTPFRVLITLLTTY